MASKDTIANLGLIGYILLLIGSLLGLFVFGIIVGFIGWIIVGIAWFMLGGWSRASSLKIIGLILILAPIVAVVAGIVGVFISISSATTVAVNTSSNVPNTSSIVNVSAFVNSLIVAIVVALEIYLVGEFFHIIAHYKAYKLLNVSTFKYAMFTWSAAFIARVVALVLIIHAIVRILPVIVTNSIGRSGIIFINNTSLANISNGVVPGRITTELLGTLGSALLAGIIGFILGIIASIISMLAFNSVKNVVLEKEEQYPSSSIQPGFQ